MLFNNLFFTNDKKTRNPKILTNFSKKQIFAIYGTALRYDIADNNEKADILLKIIGKDFEELAPGSNRLAVKKSNYVYKLPLDIRGIKDNYTEFMRSSELPQYLAKTYESNIIINVAEYVTVMDTSEFRLFEKEIRNILLTISQNYIFNDMGYIEKNMKNWGYRDNNDVVCLDYGYLWKKHGQEQALLCPKCNSPLIPNFNFSDYVCDDRGHCGTIYDPETIRRRMNVELEKQECKEFFQKEIGISSPDFDRLIDDATERERHDDFENIKTNSELLRQIEEITRELLNKPLYFDVHCKDYTEGQIVDENSIIVEEDENIDNCQDSDNFIPSLFQQNFSNKNVISIVNRKFDGGDENDYNIDKIEINNDDMVFIFNESTKKVKTIDEINDAISQLQEKFKK